MSASALATSCVRRRPAVVRFGRCGTWVRDCSVRNETACQSWARSLTPRPPSPTRRLCSLVLDVHGGGIHCLLTGDSLQSGKYSPIFVLVALHCQAALFIAICPSHADEVFLRLGKRHQGSYSQGEGSYSDGTPYASVNVLSVADLS